MARPKKMTVSVINITTHPHSPENYVSLFRDAFALRRGAKYRGDQFIQISQIYPMDASDILNGAHGTLFQYVNIDTTSPWLDTVELKPVESEDGEPVVNIPEHLKPNCKMATFIFFPRGHRFFFISSHGKNNFSTAYTARALEKMFNVPELQARYGEVVVTVESREETIQQILSIPSLTQLRIGLSLPNDDDVSPQERRVVERLKRQKIKKHNHVMTGRKDEGIEPDEETRATMNVALANGYVYAEGYAGDKKVVEKTSSHPVTFDTSYDMVGSSPWTRLKDIAVNNLQRFVHRQ